MAVHPAQKGGICSSLLSQQKLHTKRPALKHSQNTATPSLRISAEIAETGARQVVLRLGARCAPGSGTAGGRSFGLTAMFCSGLNNREDTARHDTGMLWASLFILWYTSMNCCFSNVFILDTKYLAQGFTQVPAFGMLQLYTQQTNQKRLMITTNQ